MIFGSKKKEIYRLLDTWKDKNADKQPAINKIITLKERALPILIKEIKDIDSKYEWSLMGFLLRKMGEYAFDEVMKVSLTNNPEISRRGNWTAAGFGRTANNKVVANLNHSSPVIRANMLYAIQCSKEIPENEIPNLIQLLEDEDGNVKKRALYTLAELGEKTIEPLLEVRRTGNKDLRRGALIALLNSYPEKLSNFDKDLIKRIDRITAPKDPPKPFSENSWIVIPKTDLDKILTLCSFHEPEIVPFVKGLDAVQCDFWHMKRDVERPTKTRVYITPVIEDKWIFLVGGWFGIGDEDSTKKVNKIINNLSNELGEAYCFTSQSRMGWYSWTISIKGKIIRQHVGENQIIDFGEPSQPEKNIRAKKIAKGENINEEWLFDWLPEIANYHCLYPEELNEKTKFSGVGYLVKTNYGLKNGTPKRALVYWNKEKSQ